MVVDHHPHPRHGRFQPQPPPQPPPQPGAALPRARRRANVATGGRSPPGVDHRSAWSRRVVDLMREHVSDIGGEANVSAAERSPIKRAAVLTTELERLESRFAHAGEASASDLDLYQRSAGNLRRLCLCNISPAHSASPPFGPRPLILPPFLTPILT
jgi:hypothetical protein